MYIAPDTTVVVCKNVPLDPTYEHTIYFETAALQAQYFASKAKHTFLNHTYQRVNTGAIKVQMQSEELYDCNYLMFQNSAFGSKWFYAFIRKVEYINNVTSQLVYELDVMQTWHFDYHLGMCYVQREHSITDGIGDSRTPENIEHGDYYYDTLNVPGCPFAAGQYSIVIAYAEAELLSPSVVSNVFTGVRYEIYNTPNEAYTRLQDINSEGKADQIVNVFQVPSAFIAGSTGSHFTTTELVTEISAGLNNPFTNFGGYVPKNNKLFTSQFFGLSVISSSGETATYNYEDFNDPFSPKFGLTYSMSSTPTAILVPNRYKGTNGQNIMESISCNDFPQCCYATDSYKAYIALNSGKRAAMVADAGFSFMRTLRPGAGVEDRASFYQKAAHMVAEEYDRRKMPDTVRGVAGNGTTYAKNIVGFSFFKYRLHYDFAKKVDDFFTKFGYAVNEVKTPNRSSRPHYNFVKTVGCEAYGSVPCDDIMAICNIYDKGITFWKNAGEIGDYSLDNSPVTGGNNG